jgi:putative endonuclease
MKPNSNTQKGKEAEDLAAKFLQSLGYEILVRNYRYKRGEIDIIAECKDEKKSNKVIVFVEVKSRKNNDFGFPEESVNARKAELIHQTADNYLIENNLHHQIRFDIIAITNTEIEHLIDAF